MDLAHHGGQGAALQPVLQRRQHIGGARQVQPQQVAAHAGQEGGAEFGPA